MKVFFTSCLIIAQFFLSGSLCAQNIVTIAGGMGDHGMATAAEMYHPNSVAVDKWGNIYLVDVAYGTIRKIDTSGIITTFAGSATGISGYSGDGGQATLAEFNNPRGIASDTSGNIFIADGYNRVIRKISTNGIITTCVGGGSSLGDGGLASNAMLGNPYGITFDKLGNFYIVDKGASRVRKVNTFGIISTIAGTGVAGFSGDTHHADSAQINLPSAICIDIARNIYISDNSNTRIRKINTTGIISTFAGNGGVGDAGDGGPATAANINVVTGLAADTIGNIYIADTSNNVIRKVDTFGIITTVAGRYGSIGFAGDNGPATSAKLNGPTGIAFDHAGNYYVADYFNNRIRKVNTSGIITTVGGCNFSSPSGYKGDGGPAISALLANPLGLCYDTAHNIYIADAGNHCVRQINTSGIISTVAGDDTSGYNGDSSLATHARLANPVSVAADKKGNLFVCDGAKNVIRKVDAAGIIYTYAGRGTAGYSGDGNTADSAKLNAPYNITTDKYGNLYIIDASNYRIRKVDTNRIISTVAGIGTSGFFGDGGPATAALINPQAGGIYVDDTGNILFSDANNLRVRKINTAGIISTIAGNGTAGYTGDGGPAIVAGIGSPSGITEDKNGHLYISTNSSIREVDNAGIISTDSVGGSSYPGFFANGILVDTSGDILLSQSANDQIYEVYNAKISVYTPTTTICSGSSITFTATATTGRGHALSYHWLQNNIPVGTDSSAYTTTSVDSGDKVYCYITEGSSATSIATSNTITISTIPDVTPSISFSINPTSLFCQGRSVTCNPIPANEGTHSTIEWYKNGLLVLTEHVSLLNPVSPYIFAPTDGDSVYCRLTSNATCRIIDSITSNVDVFHTTALDTLSASITVSPSDTICNGTSDTFRVSSINAGGSPIYEWYINWRGSSTGNTLHYRPTNGDVVYCRVVNTTTCVITDTAYSDSIKITVLNPITPSVNVSVSTDTICKGTQVECTANGTNTGSAPIYTWYLNGANTFTGYTYSLFPNEGDIVVCVLQSNAACASTQTATSSNTTFTFEQPPVVTITSDPGPVILRGDAVTFYASLQAASAPVDFQWVQDGSPIPGATNSTYVSPNFSVWDSVYCIATAAPVCGGPVKSNTLYIDVYHSMKLYPDPNTGDFVINGNDDNANGDVAGINIFNSAGRLVYKESTAFNVSTLYTHINLGHQLPAGVYLARITYRSSSTNLVFTIK